MKTKTYTRRDSATSILRKIGLQARDYDLFITKKSDHEFECRIGAAIAHLESLKPAKPKGVSAMARELILAGHTNQEIWEALKAAFNLDDSKKHYPTWYRCEMKRRGLLPQEA